MKNLETQTQKILSYLYGEMNAQEKTSFEKELETDQSLINELLLHHEVDKAIAKETKIKNFRHSLDAIHQEHVEPRKNKIVNLQNKWYWAAASITVFSGTAIYTFSKNAQSSQKLYKNYYEVWQPGFVTRGIETESVNEAIFALFDEQNYTACIEKIQQLDNEAKISPKIQLIHGCSLMELGKFNEAIKVFNYFESQDYTIYTETALWYKALSYLRNDDRAMAKESLQQIADNENTYATEAKELLKKLK
ncbi:MAG: tol-pal system YbgF family protein [Salinivirgaceae bacterium]